MIQGAKKIAPFNLYFINNLDSNIYFYRYFEEMDQRKLD